MELFLKNDPEVPHFRTWIPQFLHQRCSLVTSQITNAKKSESETLSKKWLPSGGFTLYLKILKFSTEASPSETSLWTKFQVKMNLLRDPPSKAFFEKVKMGTFRYLTQKGDL